MSWSECCGCAMAFYAACQLHVCKVFTSCLVMFHGIYISYGHFFGSAMCMLYCLFFHSQSSFFILKLE